MRCTKVYRLDDNVKSNHARLYIIRTKYNTKYMAYVVVLLHELVETKFPHLNAWWGHMLENVHWVTLSQKKSLYRTLTFWGRCGWGRKFSKIRCSSILRTLLWSPQMKKILHVWYNLFSDDLATWNTRDFSTFFKTVT